MKVKIESFAIIANTGTSKERVITTYQVKNDDMNTVSQLSFADIGELLHVISDGGVITAASIGVSEESEDKGESERLIKTYVKAGDF